MKNTGSRLQIVLVNVSKVVLILGLLISLASIIFALSNWSQYSDDHNLMLIGIGSVFVFCSIIVTIYSVMFLVLLILYFKMSKKIGEITAKYDSLSGNNEKE